MTTESIKKPLPLPAPNLVKRGVYIKSGKVQIAARLDPDVFDALDQYAFQSKRSLSNAIQCLLCEALNAKG